MVKLLRVVYARNPEKKLRAEFSDGKAVEFGDINYTDYTLSKNMGQRERYRARHKVDLMGDDPRTPGYLAWHLLWGQSTSLAKNIATYKRLYDL